MVRRVLVQAVSTVLANGNLPGWLTGRLYRGPLKAVCVPGLNCYSCPGALGACPVGSWQSSMSGALPKFPLYVLGLLLLFALAFGRTVCGWLCPFGLVQDVLHRLPVPKLGKRSWMRPLTRVRWVMLALAGAGAYLAYLAAGIGKPLFCAYVCPAGMLEGALPLMAFRSEMFAAAGKLTFWKGAVLAVLLVAMVFVYRPFCRFLCPLGLWYGFWNRFALLGVTVDETKCVHCGRCASACPMDAELAGDAHCISCGRCLEVCPTAAISFRRFGTSVLTRRSSCRYTQNVNQETEGNGGE